MADVVEEAIDLSQHFESEGETDLIIAEDDEEEPEIGDDDDVCQEMLVPIVEITEDTENNWKPKRRRKRVKTKNGFSSLPNESIDDPSTNGQPSTSRFAGGDGEQPTCSNCNTQKTSMWRRDKSANLVCNACGLYIKLYGVNRPIQMRKDTVRVRRRKNAKDAKKEETEKNQSKDLFHKPKSLPDDYCVVRSELSNVEHERAVLPPSSLDLAKFFPSIAKPFPIESVSLKSGLSKNLPPYVRNLCVNLSSSNEDIVTITPTRSKEIKISSEASQDSNDVSIEIKKVKTNVERKFPNFGKNSAVEITLVKPKVSKQNPTTSNPDWEVSVLPKPPPLKKRPLPKIESMSQVLMQKAIEAQQNDLSEAYGQLWDKISQQTNLLQNYNLLSSQLDQQSAINGGLPMPDFRGLQPLKLKEQVNTKRAKVEHSSLDALPIPSHHLTPSMVERLHENFSEGVLQSHAIQLQQQRSTKVSPSTSCANCNTQQTSIWRRNKLGLPICNACGLYFRLHGVDRPVNLRNDVIRKRMRKGERKLKTSKKDLRTSDNLVETYEDELIDQSERHLLAN